MIPATEMDAVKDVLVTLQRQNASRQWGTVTAALRKRLGVSDTVATEYLEAMIGRGVEMSATGRMVTICLDLAPQISEGEVAWRQAVSMHSDLTANTLEAMYSLWPAVSDWPAAQYDALIYELLWLRRQPSAQTLYLTSAAGRLASSKLLSALPKPALRDLGIAVDSLLTAPVCFLIAGAAEPETVVLVENRNAFERAIACSQDLPVAWISTYGFGAAALDAGERMVDGLEGAAAVSATRLGSPPPLADLLCHPSIRLWGDLDVAGLQIFMRARRRLPALSLSGLYAPMLAHLEAGGGHPYVSLTGKGGQNLANTCADPDIAPLLAACRARAVDQEWLQPDDIRNHCLGALSPPVSTP